MISVVSFNASPIVAKKKNKPKGACPKQKRKRKIKRMDKKNDILQDLKDQLIIRIDDWDTE